MSKSKGAEFVPIPGDKMLQAIGLVAVKWSALEFQIDNLLYWASSPDDDDTARVMARGGVQQRWERLKEILKREYSDRAGTTGLITHVDMALSIKGERDKILYGLYSEPASGATRAEVVILTLKSRKMTPDWPVTRLRVVQTADKIDALCTKLFDHLIQHGETVGNSVLLTTWRHQGRS